MNAQTLLRLAQLMMPPTREEWLRAMVHEIQSVPISDREGFALGCLKASCVERIRSMTAAPPLRIVPGLFGAALLTVLCIANGASFLPSAPVVGSFLLVASVLWLAILLAVLSQEARLVAGLAVIGALFYGAIGALALARVPAFVPNGEMLKILAVEGLILFAAAFAAAQIRYFWSAREAC